MNNFQKQDFVPQHYPSKNVFFEKAIYKLFALKSRMRGGARAIIDAFEPRILKRLTFFDEKAGEGKGRYERRFREMLDALEYCRPKNIHEMGSGRSSLVFAAWANKHNIKYKAFEQLPFWQEVSNGAVQPFGDKTPVEYSDIKMVDQIGGRFEKDIPLDADFIFVDAPTIKKSPDFITYTKKAAFTDVPDLLRRGGKPRVIMVDSRTATVDIILSELEKSGMDFIFKPGFMWAMQRHRYKDALSCRLHSIFYIS